MSVKYIKVLRKVLAGEDAGMFKTYGMAKSVNLIKLEDVCHLVSGHASISSGDVKNAFDALIWVMEYEIKRGSTVQFGDLGTFRLTISTEGTVNEEDFNAHKIKKARLKFTPGKALLKAVSEVSFEAYDERDKECEKPHAI